MELECDKGTQRQAETLPGVVQAKTGEQKDELQRSRAVQGKFLTLLER